MNQILSNFAYEDTDSNMATEDITPVIQFEFGKYAEMISKANELKKEKEKAKAKPTPE